MGAQLLETIAVEDSQVDLVVTEHILTYLNDPHGPAKTSDIGLITDKAREALPQVFDTYKRTRAYMTGAVVSASTKLNIVFSFKKTGVRRFEFKLITIEVKVGFVPKKRNDYLVKVSKKTLHFKGRQAAEIGPNIYALDTSFEGADPYGLILGPLVREIVARRKEFAPGFFGSFDAAEDSIYCVAQVDDLGNFFVDSAFWQPYGEFRTLEVR